MSARLVLHLLWIATALRVLLPSHADPDLWGHLLFGSLLLQGVLPATNGFAYTTPDHPWVNHEILAEAAMAAVYEAGGAAGLAVMKAGLGLGTLAVVYLAARRRSRSAAASAVATAAAAAVMAPGLMIRPQLFTLLFLAAALAVLAAERWRPRGAAWALPPLVALWTNTHGGVLAGIGLAALGILGGLAARLARGRAGAREVLAAGVLLALLAGALLLNPYGRELPRFLVADVTPRVPITEWAPVRLGDLSFPAFKALLLAVAALGLARARAVRLPEALVVAAAALAALAHRRHIPLFAVAAAPLFAALLAHAWRRARPAVAAAARPLRAGVAAVAALQLVLAAVAGIRGGGRIAVDPRAYPVQALRFLAQNDIAGNVALPFRWSEYALWALPPGAAVAVDGRFTTAYPQALLEEAWRFMRGGPGWDALLTRYPTDVVVADRRQAPARLLRGHPEWEYVYSDPVSVIFIRRVPSQAPTLARFRAGALRYDRAPLDLAFPAVTPARPATATLASRAAAAHRCAAARAGAPSARVFRRWML